MLSTAKMTRIAVLLLFISVCICNVEKTIFIAPTALITPNDVGIGNLLLTSINPTHRSIRTYLNASFPSDDEPKGTQTWALLEGLCPGQRYELRICWLATVGLISPRSRTLH